MWALMNPGGKKKRGGHRRRVPAALKFMAQYRHTHKGSTARDAAAAWRESGSSMHAHKLSRASHFRKVPRKYVSRGDIPNIVRSAVRGAVCSGEGSLAAARKRYCTVKAPAMIDPRGPSGASAEWSAGMPWAANPRRRYKVVRHKKHRSFSFKSFNPSGALSGATSALKPQAFKSALPVVTGVLASAAFVKMVSGYASTPAMLKSRTGKYVLGAASVILLKILGGMKDAATGDKLALGALTLTLGGAIAELTGIASGTLAGDDFNEGLPGWQGMGDFVTPPQITGAVTMPTQQAQYQLPMQPQAVSQATSAAGEMEAVSAAMSGMDEGIM